MEVVAGEAAIDDLDGSYFDDAVAERDFEASGFGIQDDLPCHDANTAQVYRSTRRHEDTKKIRNPIAGCLSNVRLGHYQRIRIVDRPARPFLD